MKVYMVSTGSYSDYSIDSVWSTSEKALDREHADNCSTCRDGDYDHCPNETTDSYSYFISALARAPEPVKP